MPTYLTPGVYIEETSAGARPIEAVGTSTAAFLGVAPKGDARLNEVVPVNSWSEFVRHFVDPRSSGTPLSNAVFGFFLNGGGRCYVLNVGDASKGIGGGGKTRRGVDLLEEIDGISMVAAPGFTDVKSYSALLDHCEKMKYRVAILDSPQDATEIDALTKVATVARGGGEKPPSDGLAPRQTKSGHGAFYFPWIVITDALDPDKQVDAPPSGHIAGTWARTDAARGVHKAPANEPLRGALGVTYRLTHEEQAKLNPEGVNCIRLFGNEGIRVWGARTRAESASEWRYLNVRRLFNMIEESIERNTRWVVFEPNDLSLWKSIRRDVSAFLMLQWRQGALMGRTPEEAFFVKCDRETNPKEVVDAGMVVTVIGAAPVKPAEFVVFQIGQSVAGAETEEAGGARL